MKKFKSLVVSMLLVSMLFSAKATQVTQNVDGQTAQNSQSLSDEITEDMKDVNSYFSSYNKAITREDFCYLIVSLMAEQDETDVDSMYSILTDTQKDDAFDDVTEQNKYISLAKKYELVVGSGNSNFSPQDNINREEIANIIYNYVKKFSDTHLKLDKNDSLQIEDHVEISDWAKESVNYVILCDLMPLDTNGNFDPKRTVTVEEAILLISDFRTFLETPVPTEQVQDEKMPNYIFIIAGTAIGIAILIAIIILLKNNQRKKMQNRSEEEQRRMNALMNKIVPNNNAEQNPNDLLNIADMAESTGTVILDSDSIPRAPQIKLVDIMGSAVNKTFSLDNILTIGRMSDNVLQISENTVSSKHCKIYYDGIRVLLEQTGARNPVKVEREGNVLQLDKPLPLSDGDIIYLGSLRVKVNLIYF